MLSVSKQEFHVGRDYFKTLLNCALPNLHLTEKLVYFPKCVCNVRLLVCFACKMYLSMFSVGRVDKLHYAGCHFVLAVF